MVLFLFIMYRTLGLSGTVEEGKILRLIRIKLDLYSVSPICLGILNDGLETDSKWIICDARIVRRWMRS